MNFGLFSSSTLQRVSHAIKNQEYQKAEKILKFYWSLVKEKFSNTEDSKIINKFSLRMKNMERILKSKKSKAGGNVKSKAKAPARKATANKSAIRKSLVSNKVAFKKANSE